MGVVKNIKEIKDFLERIAIALETIENYLSTQQRESEKSDKKIVANKSNPVIRIDKNSFVNDYTEIEKFLRSKNIKIKRINMDGGPDVTLDKIAQFMGDRFSHIKLFYSRIKRNLNTGKRFIMDLSNYKQEEIASITQLCNNLHRIAFLTEYRYDKSPNYMLYVKVNGTSQAINFFTGGWLERYVIIMVIKAIESISLSKPINYSYLKNPQIILPNGDDFELDVIFKIKDEYFWFEAKTGDYQKYINKYSKIAKILNLDCEHSYLILTDITESEAQTLSRINKISIVNINDFFEVFRGVIQHLEIEEEEKLEDDVQYSKA